MTQINLPRTNITGSNLWSQVEDNDSAIANVVNGSLDNGNIAAGADINASKLLDGSITAAKLGTDSVTNAKINSGAVGAAELAAQAVISGKLKITTFTNSASGSWTSGAGTDFAVVQQSSVTPGLYLAIGELLSTNVAVLGPYFTTSGGTATITQDTTRTTGASSKGTAFALIQVDSTTTVQVSVGRIGNTGSVVGVVSLFGIAAS